MASRCVKTRRRVLRAAVSRDEAATAGGCVVVLEPHPLEDAPLRRAPTDVVVDHVRGHGRRPRIERAVAAELVDGVDDLDHRVLGEILVVPVSAPEEAADRALDDGAEPIVQCRCRIGIAGADTREKLAVVEGRGRKSRLRRACIM